MAQLSVRTFPSYIWMELATTEIQETILSPEPTMLVLNCLGGDAQAGLAIHDIYKLLWRDTIVLCGGTVASAALLVLAAFPRHRRFVLPTTQFLIHPVSTWVGGRLPDIIANVASAHATQTMITQTLTSLGLPSEWLALAEKNEVWITAQEMVTHGVCQYLDGPGAPKELGESEHEDK